MPIAAKCPTCEHSYNVPDSQRGKRVKCRNCADIFVVGAGGRKEREDDREDDRDDRRGKETARDRRDDRDDDRRPDRRDRDRDDKPRKKKAQDDPGSLMPILLIVGGVFLLIVVGGGIAIFWAASRQTAQGIEINQDGGRIVFNPGDGNPGIVLNNPGGGQPHRRGAFHTPANIDEALQDINEQFNDVFVPNKRIEWLGGQKPVENKRREVCDVLWKVIQKSNEHFTKESANNVFCKWAGPEQSDKVIELLGKKRVESLDALTRLKPAKGIPALCKQLLVDGWERGRIIQVLAAYGQLAAEKEVVKLVNAPDPGLRNDINNLLTKWGTKTSLIAEQLVVDLNGSRDDNVVRAALETLAKTPVDPAKQRAVAQALKGPMLNPNNGISNLALQAAAVWGTADLAPELIALIEKGRSEAIDAAGKLKLAATVPALCQCLATNGGQRRNILTALEAIGPQAAQSEVVKLINSPDQGLRRDITNLLQKWGGGKPSAVLDQILADINEGKDDKVVRTALDTLAKTPVDAAKQGDVVKALKKVILSPNAEVSHAALLVAVTWATVDLSQELIVLLENQASRADKNKVMDALVRINTDATRGAVVKQLAINGLTRGYASQLIIKTGSVFEPQMLAYISLVPDVNHRRDAIRILGAIGTAASLPILQTLSNDKQLGGSARQAMLALRNRLARPQ